MVSCSTDYEPEIDEFNISELTPIKSTKIKSSRVQEARISYESILQQIIPAGNTGPGGGFVVIGEIVLFHIDDELYNMSRQELCRYMDAVLPEKGFFDIQSTSKIRLGCQLLRNYKTLIKENESLKTSFDELLNKVRSRK